MCIRDSNGASDNVRFGSGSAISYTVNPVTVTQLSKLGEDTKARKYMLHYVFPTDISPITLDWGDNDTIEEYTVTFSFDYFTTEAGDVTGGVGGPSSPPIPENGPG